MAVRGQIDDRVLGLAYAAARGTHDGLLRQFHPFGNQGWRAESHARAIAIAAAAAWPLAHFVQRRARVLRPPRVPRRGWRSHAGGSHRVSMTVCRRHRCVRVAAHRAAERSSPTGAAPPVRENASSCAAVDTRVGTTRPGSGCGQRSSPIPTTAIACGAPPKAARPQRRKSITSIPSRPTTIRVASIATTCRRSADCVIDERPPANERDGDR